MCLIRDIYATIGRNLNLLCCVRLPIHDCTFHTALIVFRSTAACSIWHFQCGSAHKFRAKLADFSIDIDALEKHADFFVSQGLSTLGNL